MLADVVRQRLVPGHAVTYIVSRNINYTNICWVRCSFCNFYRTPGSNAPDSYVLTREEIHQKLTELSAVGGVEMLMQGGLNPKLKLEVEVRAAGMLQTIVTGVLHVHEVTNDDLTQP